MNRLFRMFGAKVALMVIALVFFAGMPEFGAMEAEAKPRRGRSAQNRKVKRGKSTRGRSRGRNRGKATRSRGRGRHHGKATRGRHGRGRNRGRVVRGGGRRGRYDRGGRNGRRRVIIKKVRGRNGRIYKRRIVVGGSRRRGGSRNRRERYSTPTNTSNPTASVTPKTVPMRPTRGVVIPSDRAREIQAALKNAGYYQGEVTGNYDDATREAMRSFQRANGIKDTGMPTAPALLKLGLTKHKSDAGDTSAPSVTPPPPSQPDGTPNQ